MGYEKEAYLYLLFHYTGKKDFQESTPKIQNANENSILGCRISLESLAFHIYYVKYENTLTCKMISWDSGGMMF